MNYTQTLQEYLDKEKITYEIYQEERKIKTNKRILPPTYDEPRKKQKLEETKSFPPRPPLIERPINERLFLIFFLRRYKFRIVDAATVFSSPSNFWISNTK